MKSKETKETKTKKRTQIKDLPDSGKTLTAKDLKEVKGGVTGPCQSPRVAAVGPCGKPRLAGVNPCFRPRN